MSMTVDPAGTGTPPTSVSFVAIRVMLRSGTSYRNSSSIAWGTRLRSARTASSWSGCVSSVKSRFPVERYVVSTPAGRSNRTKEKISSSLRCSPSSSAWARSLMRSLRVAATLLEDGRDVLLHFLGGGDRLFLLAEEAQDRDRPPLELLVSSRETEQPGDDLGREGKGEFGNEFRVPTVGEPIDQAVGDLALTIRSPNGPAFFDGRPSKPTRGTGGAARRPCRG